MGHPFDASQPESHVVDCREVGEEIEALEYHPYLLTDPLVSNSVPVHLYSVDEHLSRVRFHQEIDAAK